MGVPHHPDANAVETRRPPVDAALAAKFNPVERITAQKQLLRIDLAVETLTNLRLGAVACLRIEPCITHMKSGKLLPARALALLDDDDLAAIDVATARYAGLYLVGAELRGQPPVVVPASFRTLGTRKGRALLQEALGASPARVKKNVLTELVDVDKGTPEGRLIEVAGLMQAVSRGVFMRVAPGRDMVAPSRGSAVQGLTLDVGELRGDARITSEMLAFAEQMRGVAPALMVQGLSSDVLFAMATVAGLSHAGVRAASILGRQAA